jgi:hypothetical protein
MPDYNDDRDRGEKAIIRSSDGCCFSLILCGAFLGYPHSSTSIFISKKEYFILVIKILYSILISSVSVLYLYHILYTNYSIFYSPPSLFLSLHNSLLLLQWCYSVLTGCSPARGLWRFTVQPVRYQAVYRGTVRTPRTPVAYDSFGAERCGQP